MQTAPFRERLTGAAAAIALQGALAALFVFSFVAVRHLNQEKETILVLPPLARPVPPRQPLTIDARGRPPRTGAPPPVAAPPAYAQPGFQLAAPGGALPALGRDLARCRIETLAALTPEERKACLVPEAMARRDPNLLPIDPDKPVKNAPIWQAEAARRNAPAALPGAAGAGIIGILGTLLFDPGAFRDRSNYSYGPPNPEIIDGAEASHQFATRGHPCPQFDDMTRKNCTANLGALGKLSIPLAGTAPVIAAHVSDAAFEQARAAAQARQSIYARPVLASGAKTGGGNDKNGPSGGAAGGSGNPDNPVSGPGR